MPSIEAVVVVLVVTVVHGYGTCRHIEGDNNNRQLDIDILGPSSNLCPVCQSRSG